MTLPTARVIELFRVNLVVAVAVCVVIAAIVLPIVGDGHPADTVASELGDEREKEAITRGVYVPAYSHVYHQRESSYLLTVTLSVRNSDLRKPMTLRSVDYHDTNGKLVKSFLKESQNINPLACAEFRIPKEDTSGGSGASFVVQWSGDDSINSPVIESIMIDTSSNQGIAFACRGVEITQPVK